MQGRESGDQVHAGAVRHSLATAGGWSFRVIHTHTHKVSHLGSQVAQTKGLYTLKVAHNMEMKKGIL